MCVLGDNVQGKLAPVVPEGVGWGLLDAHEGLGVQDAVVHVDGVATVLPLSLCLWGQVTHVSTEVP